MSRFKASLLTVSLLTSSWSILAQGTKVPGLEHLTTTPLTYSTYYTSNPPVIDGDLSDAEWSKASWTNRFADIEGSKKPSPSLNTQAKILWDDQYLYIGAELEEPHVWGTLKKHDQIVFYDDDFEIFLNPDNNGHQYFEIEVNALNTIFDLFLSKPYRSNTGALISWDAKGLKSAVKVHGTLNDPTDRDKGWAVEMAIPFSSITIGNETRVPKEGSLWRINFSRVDWDMEVVNGKYVKKKNDKGKVLPEQNWVWSPQGVINMHLPERWGYLQFTKRASQNVANTFSIPYAEKQKQFLWVVYYRQKEYQQKNKKYALSLSDLGLEKPVTIDGKVNYLILQATARQFTVSISGVDLESWSLNDDGLIHKL